LLDAPSTLKTHESIERAVLEIEAAQTNKEAVKQRYGILGRFTLANLETVDMPFCSPIDIMHLLFLNVVPQLYKLLSNQFFGWNDESSYVLDTKAWMEIDKQINESKTEFPSVFGKNLCPLGKNFGHFKAEDWQHFGLYILPTIVCERLGGTHKKNILNFVEAIQLMTQKNIRYEEIERIETLLARFLRYFRG
jgi:hypothetical protein